MVSPIKGVWGGDDWRLWCVALLLCCVGGCVVIVVVISIAPHVTMVRFMPHHAKPISSWVVFSLLV